MLSVITEEVLEAAREMNRRDVRRVQQIYETGREPDDVGSPEEEDDKIWAKYKGIKGLKGVEDLPLKMGGSYYSWGPYSRNRRILADIALAAGWGVDKARILEERCVNMNAKHLAGVSSSMDMSHPSQPRKKSGQPFTFQHISWTFLRGYIEREIKDMDPTKLAIIKAAVLDLYGTNSKSGEKMILACQGERKDDEALPVTDADIEAAQEEIDKQERYFTALRAFYNERDSFVPPNKVKLRIKAFIKAKGMSQQDFCNAIGVTEDQLEEFMLEGKRRPQFESKVFHNAVPYMQKANGK
ncbi:hypothetical protein GGR52DRAFT_5582 [Hypoxylon sp. FL1284]|nr:hypothetical protein GGR52DRAFT_5582 [Hypoxylon sp. FL1284]